MCCHTAAPNLDLDHDHCHSAARCVALLLCRPALIRSSGPAPGSIALCFALSCTCRRQAPETTYML